MNRIFNCAWLVFVLAVTYKCWIDPNIFLTWIGQNGRAFFNLSAAVFPYGMRTIPGLDPMGRVMGFLFFAAICYLGITYGESDFGFYQGIVCASAAVMILFVKG